MSKGSRRRETLVSKEEADANWRAAFGPSRLERMVQEQEMEEAKAKASQEGAVLSVPPSQGEDG